MTHLDRGRAKEAERSIEAAAGLWQQAQYFTPTMEFI